MSLQTGFQYIPWTPLYYTGLNEYYNKVERKKISENCSGAIVSSLDKSMIPLYPITCLYLTNPTTCTTNMTTWSLRDVIDQNCA